MGFLYFTISALFPMAYLDYCYNFYSFLPYDPVYITVFTFRLFFHDSK